MATAPITSTAARDLVFASKNEEVKSFAPKNKVNDAEIVKAKADANKTNETKSARDAQESKQAAQAVQAAQEAKPTAVPNTRGESTGGTLHVIA